MSTQKLTAVIVAGALVCLNLNTAIPAQVEKRPVLAVMPLPADKVTEIEARQVTVHIIDHMKRAGDFIVLDFVHSENALQDLGQGLYSGVDRETAIRAGNILSADKVITGTLGREGDIYDIRLEMIDIAAGRVEGQSTVRSKMVFQELSVTMRTLLDSLLHLDLVQADMETPDFRKKADDVAWEAYSKLGTEEALTLYISSYPSGKYVSEARQKIKALQDAVQRQTEKKSDRPVPEVGRTWREPETGMEFVWIPSGEFMMGSPTGRANERPVRRVHLDGFWMGKYEVTQGEWLKVMDSNPSFSQKGERYPVESVSWTDVQEYVRRFNSRTGHSFRLPTEAEWEYACRAGTTGDRYGVLDEIAWYEGNTGGSTRPVGMKTPNSFGLYDMLGNVWEWCQDFYGLYKNEDARNPRGSASGPNRVFRGASCLNIYKSYIRATIRDRASQTHKHRNLGFRLVVSGEVI